MAARRGCETVEIKKGGWGKAKIPGFFIYRLPKSS